MQGRLKAACALAAAGLVLTLPGFLLADSLTVKTEQGKVHGKTINDGKVKAFLGLPYAAPPVGDLRWKAPEAPAKWKGERDATRFGSRCIQGHASPDMSFLDNGPSEDCLYLNVYSPSDATDKSNLPVMFWIHGGGFVAGAGGEPRHNGDFLPLKGVVLVTFNYRLGVFGFLATEDLAKEANGTAGNYGFMDMIAALHWVQANIRQFGGNLGNVTIFGESAGSFAVSTLVASPMARGLFEKAIGESGAAFGGSLAYEPLALREKKDSEWAASLGVTSLAQLRAVPSDKIHDESQRRGMIGFPPDIDGKVLVEPVPDTYAAGRQAHIPVLAGWNADEGVIRVKAPVTVEQWKETAAKLFPDRTEEFLKLYPGETDAQATRSAIDYYGDSFIAFSTWKWVEAQSKTGESPVYRYHFELAAPPSKYFTPTAFHADDIEYVFGTLDTRPESVWRPEDRKMTELFMSYWTNFAKTGDPNGPGLPVWPRYDKDGSILHLNSTVTSGLDAARPRYEFLLRGVPAFRF